jgi:transcription termination factor Rho
MEGELDETPAAGAEEQNATASGTRRRRSRRRRSRRHSQNAQAPAVLTPVEGFLWRRDDGKAFLLPVHSRFHPSPDDPLVDPALISRWYLESGLRLTATASTNGSQRGNIGEIATIEGLVPDEYRQKAVPFAELVSIDPTSRFRLETAPGVLEPRVIELMTPIGKGQRCLIVSPPKAGKTTLLQQLAHAIAVNHPETQIFVLLVDERPEEVTHWKRSVVQGEVYASSSDE